MENEQFKIGIILGSTRVGRVSPQVGDWVKEFADARKDAKYEIVDIKEYHLPFLGDEGNQDGVIKWNEKLSELDGFVFIVSEYNHSMSGALKNALDVAHDGWMNKAAGIVSYGSAGGVRAAEHLRNVLGELQVADVRTQVILSLFLDFENRTVFKPQPLHATNMNAMLNQLLKWTTALKTIR